MSESVFSERFEQFRAHVLRDPALLEKLRAFPDSPAFAAECSATAGVCGIELSAAEVERALRAAKREWREHWER